ncbi:MAG TPA: ATP-binding cassette domain-containing protein [Ignavibacteriaceae bacterium]|nr:ATP-binding cassette domain-containing protein [Ignavibacteriaceae bacterium]
MAEVEVRNLSKSFGDSVVLDNISLKINEGENVVVFGRSGTGKSVLIKCIVKLLEPDSGEVFIEGENILLLSENKLNEVRKQIGFLFQGSALYDSMSVRENLAFPLIRNFNFTTKEVEAKVKSSLEKVSLEDSIDKMPAELSGGMKKRIGLARTIITEPKLILYDEPTTGLDPITTKEISQLIVELQKDLKTTSIVVTHDLICAKIIASHAVVLKDGKIKYEGNLENLVSTSDPFLRDFFTSDILEVKNGSNK